MRSMKHHNKYHDVCLSKSWEKLLYKQDMMIKKSFIDKDHFPTSSNPMIADIPLYVRTAQ
jgi:hypothetical protein